MTDSTLDLIRKHSQIAKVIACGFMKRLPKTVLREDIEQAALIGLWDAARKHGEDQSEHFEHYAKVRVRGAIIDELRNQDWLPRRTREARGEDAPRIVRFDDLGLGVHAEEQFAASNPNPEDAIDAKAQYAEALRAPLSAGDRRVIELTEMRGITQRVVGKIMGVTEPRISQRRDRALRVMRAHLTGELDGINQGVTPNYRINQKTLRIIQERHEHIDTERADRATAIHPRRHPSPAPEPRPVPAGGLGSAPARHAARPVPGGGRVIELGAVTRRAVLARAAQSRAVVSEQADPGRDWGDFRVTAAAPSTLPEAGIDLNGELLRYRDWLIEQALIRSLGNKAKAARLLGLKRTTLIEMLKRSQSVIDLAPSEPDSAREESPPMKHPEPETAVDVTEPQAPSVPITEWEVEPQALAPESPSAMHQRARDPYQATCQKIANLKSEGLNVAQIARRLGLNRYLVEKILRTQMPLAKCGGDQ